MDNDKIQETSESGQNSNAGVPPTSSDRARLLKLTAIALATAVFAVVGIIGYMEYTDKSRPEFGAFRPIESIPDSELSGSDLAYKIDRQGRALADKAKTVEDQKKAEQKFKDALALFEEHKHERGQAETLNDLGSLYAYWKTNEQGRWEEALRHYSNSLEIKRKIQWHWAEGNTLANMGNLFQLRKQFDKAAEHFQLAVQAYEKAGDQGAAATARTELAAAYFRARQLPKARECYEKCLQEARDRRNLKEQARLLGSLGSVCIARNQHSDAVKYFREAIEVSRKAGSMEYEKWALNSLGSIYECIENNGKAASECYEKAAEISISNESPEINFHIMERLALLYYTEDQYPKAAESCMKALELAKKLNKPNSEEEIKTYLQNIYRKWAAVDPGNGELKRIKAVLYQGAGKEAIHRSFYEAIQANDVEKVRNFLGQGADPNRLDEFGHTPVETAASKGNLEIVKLLLESGADPQKKNRYSRPVLEAAYTSALFHGHEKTAEYFVDIMGVNVNAEGPAQRTALECAVQCSPEFVKKLIEKGANVNAKSRDGITPLMAAAQSHKLETVALLIDNGADVNALDKDGQTALMLVASIRDRENDVPYDSAAIVKLLLERGADVNLKDESENDPIKKRLGVPTALMHFSVVGDPDSVKLLLEKGANVNAGLKYGSNALFLTLQKDSCFNYIRGLSQWAGSLPLRRATDSRFNGLNERRTEVIRLLAAHGLDVNAQLEDGTTALMWLSLLGNADLAKLLLEKGADPNAKLADGSTALIWAISRNSEQISRRFGSYADFTSTRHGRASLDRAFDERQIDVVKLLLDHGADINVKLVDGTTPLMWAAILGQTEMVKLLAERGADLNAGLDKDGSTALMWAAANDRADVMRILIDKGAAYAIAGPAGLGLKSEVERLSDTGADVNTKDPHGRTPLMECARGGNAETAELLLNKGADVNTRTDKGRTALIEAIYYGKSDIAELLLDRGADINARDDSGWSAIFHAAWMGQVEATELLLSKGADIGLKDAFGKTALARAVEMSNSDVAELLIKKGADVKIKGSDEMPIIVTAVNAEDAPMAKLLKDHGAESTLCAEALVGDEAGARRMLEAAPQSREILKEGAMALAIAAGKGHRGMVDLIAASCPNIDYKGPEGSAALNSALKKDNSEIVGLLLDKGVQVDNRGPDGYTPLYRAVFIRDPNLVRMLLEKGADPNQGTWGEMILSVAIRSGNVEIVKLLLENGADVRKLRRSESGVAFSKYTGNKEINDLLEAHSLQQSH